MGVLNLTFRNGGFVPALDPSGELSTALKDAARRSAPGTPVVVMIHGYRYDPGAPRTDPHSRLYAVQPTPARCRRHLSWPAALGFHDRPSDPGLCLAIGWPARGRLIDAYDRAETVGRSLAALLSAVCEVLPGHPVKLMGHSLGARVALSCLGALRAPHVSQAILLAPAEFSDVARDVLMNPAARAAEILQISPVENRLFDLLLVRAMRGRAQGPALGQAPPETANWVSLALDGDGELARLAALGHRVAPRKARICHWSAYLRDGVMEFYADILTSQRLPSFRGLAPTAAD